MKLHERPIGAGPAEGFLELAPAVYRDDPHWVPEDSEALAACFGAASPWPTWGEGSTFCVPGAARASVFRTPGLEIDDTPAAFFGHWESTGDARAEALVVEAAKARARDAGAARLYGPVDLSPTVSHLLRLNGDEQAAPYMGEPYNPPRYAAGLASLGLEVDRRYVSAELGEAEMEAIAELGAPMHAEFVNRGYRFESLTVDAWLSCGDEVHELDAFKENFGAGAVTRAQLEALFTPAWAGRLDPDLSVLGYGPDGDVAGFVWCYPHYASLLVQGAGADRVDGSKLSYAEHAALLSGDGSSTFVLKTAAAAPRHRRGGLAYAGLVESILRARRKGMTRMITGPMYSENPVRRLFRHGPHGERWYGILATDLAPSRP
jgi:hypothetical protein